jgi:hypothetical protein
MRYGEKEVKGKGSVVGTAKFEIFDTVAEAVECKGEDVVLDLINTQNKTNTMNALRNAAVGKPSKNAVRTQAMSEITTAEFAEIAGDAVKLENLIARKMHEVEARLSAQRPEGFVEEADDDDEGDE